MQGSGMGGVCWDRPISLGRRLGKSSAHQTSWGIHVERSTRDEWIYTAIVQHTSDQVCAYPILSGEFTDKWSPMYIIWTDKIWSNCCLIDVKTYRKQHAIYICEPWERNDALTKPNHFVETTPCCFSLVCLRPPINARHGWFLERPLIS